MEPYTPKRILSDIEEAEMGAEFLAYLVSKADNRDPITPFSHIPSIDDNLIIHFNTTNDLKWTIGDAISWINNKECNHVIIGDRANSYSTELCEGIQELFQMYMPIKIYKNSDWIVVEINTTNKELIISNQTMKLE
jgi:hypothetical protein